MERKIVLSGIIIMFIASVSITGLVMNTEAKRSELDGIKKQHMQFLKIYEEGVAISVSNTNFMVSMRNLDSNLNLSVENGLKTELEAEIEIRALSWSLILSIQKTIKYKERFEAFDEIFETAFTYYWFDWVNLTDFLDQDYHVSDNLDFDFSYTDFLSILQTRLDELDWIPLFFIDIDTNLIFEIIDGQFSAEIKDRERSLSIQEVSIEIFSVCTIVLGLIVEVESKEHKIEILITLISVWLMWISMTLVL
jgi:hypothetical protein